ncbi:MAG TPA: class I SAM-dependent methyltransferase [Burkholderiales bacterium]|nr:class I SAM-dependent methyltransferase [Burkholderiales bacterium]
MYDNPRASPRIWQPDWLVLREMAKAIRSLLADPALRLQGARVLDFGCGSRPYENWFAGAGAQYRGADIDGGHEVRIDAQGTLACRDAEYDLVASFQVLEHVWDVAGYLGEARRVLRADGWLLLSTHGTWLYHPHPHDYRRWTADGLRREVEAQGFSLIRMEPVVGPLAWTTVFRSLGMAHFLKKLPFVGLPLSGIAAVAFNARAWLEDRATPREITANNACTYVALFRRAS